MIYNIRRDVFVSGVLSYTVLFLIKAEINILTRKHPNKKAFFVQFVATFCLPFMYIRNSYI